jgi:hypothetical protein
MLAVTSIERERARRAELLNWALAKFERFCGLVDIVPKGGGRQKFQFNQIQKLFCTERTGRDVVLKPRQIGFTTLEQARDVWQFLTVPGSRVVATCQSVTDRTPAKLLSTNYRVMFDSLERAGLKLNFRSQGISEWVLASRDSSLRIVEAGASETAANKKGRAGTISRLHLSETAFYEYADETLNALLECVPSREYGSEIVSESTPNGAAGYFYRQCKVAGAKQSPYKLHFYPWFQASEYRSELEPGERIDPRNEREHRLIALGVTAEQLKWYRHKVAEKGQDLFDQEYPSDQETCFLVSGRCFFDQAVTTKLLEKTREPIETRERARLRIYAKPVRDRVYLLSVDTSEGGGGDPSGALMFDRESGEHVATIDGQYTPWDLGASSAKLGHEYNEAEIVVERNNHGHAVLQALEREQKYPKLYKHTDDKRGWLTNAVTRPTMLDALEDAHRKGLWKTPDRQVLGQCRTFIVTDTGKAEAARGEKDDLVLAAAIGWAVRSKPRSSGGTVSVKSKWSR